MTAREQLTAEFVELLRAYLPSEDETHLFAASELGRRLVEQEVGPEELVAVHLGAVHAAIGELPARRVPDAVLRSYNLLLEAVMAYGLAYRDSLRAERRHAEQIAARERELRVLVETTRDGLMLLDAEGRLRLLNQIAATLVRRPVPDVLGRRLAPEDLPLLDERLGELSRMDVTAGESAVEWETEYDARVWLVQLLPIVAEEHRVAGSVLHLRDVTKEREVERLKNELVAVVNHELRTPLASLVGFAELMLMRDFPEAQRRQFLETILQEGRRLTALINDLLDLQRIESGRQELVLAPADVAVLVRRTVEAAGDDPAHPTSIELPAGLPPVHADADRVQQVLLNLVGNARKYSPNGGPVTISAQASEAMVEVTIADRGLGLPAEALPHLFETFYRVDNSDRRTIKGTGLGLAICRKIIEAHGGRIRAESAGPGQGSTFGFTLPVAPPVADGGEVLVVEDDAGFARLLAAELAERGYASQRTAGAETALALVAERRPRAVILDLLLPGVPGEVLLRRLREQGEDVPVVVVTAKDLDLAARRGLDELRVTAVLRKGPGVAAAAAAAVQATLGATTVNAAAGRRGEA